MSGRILRTSAVATKVVVVIVVDHDGARGGIVVIVIVVVDCAPQHTSVTLKLRDVIVVVDCIAQHTSSILKSKRAVDSAKEYISQNLQHKNKR